MGRDGRKRENLIPAMEFIPQKIPRSLHGMLKGGLKGLIPLSSVVEQGEIDVSFFNQLFYRLLYSCVKRNQMKM